MVTPNFSFEAAVPGPDLVSARRVRGMRLRALDGDAGVVSDLDFDDQRWTVRYVVVARHEWYGDVKVLVPPQSLVAMDLSDCRLLVPLTTSQVRRKPLADRHLPLTRERASEAWHFGMAMHLGFEVERYSAGARISPEELHLRSCRAVAGYTVYAGDGEHGRVDDFLIDAVTWTIRSLVVDIRRPAPGAAKKVLLPVESVDSIDLHRRHVVTGLNRQSIGGLPAYAPVAETAIPQLPC